MELYDIIVELNALSDHVAALRGRVRNAMLDEDLFRAEKKYHDKVGANVVWKGKHRRNPGEHTQGRVELFDERRHGNWRGVFGYHHGQLVVISPRGFRLSPYTSDWEIV